MLYDWDSIGYTVVETGSVGIIMMGEVFTCVVKLNLRYTEPEINFKFVFPVVEVST